MRAMRVSPSSLPSFVFKYACTPRQHCAVGPVTSTSSQRRKRKVLWNFTRLSSVVENSQRWTRTYASKSTLSRIQKDEVEPFVPWHRRSMEWSLFPGDVSLRLEELKINSAAYLFLLHCLKKHGKGSEWCWFRGVVGRAPSAVIDAGAACLLPTGSAASKKCLAGFFLNFGFAWLKKDFAFCNWWCEAELRDTSTKTASASPFVRTDSVFPEVHLYAAWASTAPLAAPASM